MTGRAKYFLRGLLCSCLLEALSQDSLLQTLPQIHGPTADKYVGFCLDTSADTTSLQGAIQEPEMLGQCILECLGTELLLAFCPHTLLEFPPIAFQNVSQGERREAVWSPLGDQTFCPICSSTSTWPQAKTPVVPTSLTHRNRLLRPLILAFHPLP